MQASREVIGPAEVVGCPLSRRHRHRPPTDAPTPRACIKLAGPPAVRRAAAGPVCRPVAGGGHCAPGAAQRLHPPTLCAQTRAPRALPASSRRWRGTSARRGWRWRRAPQRPPSLSALASNARDAANVAHSCKAPQGSSASKIHVQGGRGGRARGAAGRQRRQSAGHCWPQQHARCAGPGTRQVCRLQHQQAASQIGGAVDRRHAALWRAPPRAAPKAHRLRRPSAQCPTSLPALSRRPASPQLPRVGSSRQHALRPSRTRPLASGSSLHAAQSLQQSAQQGAASGRSATRRQRRRRRPARRCYRVERAHKQSLPGVCLPPRGRPFCGRGARDSQRADSRPGPAGVSWRRGGARRPACALGGAAGRACGGGRQRRCC